MQFTNKSGKCHEAAAFAKTTRRQKIKVEDFKFVLRRDPIKHGRVLELLNLQKIIQDAKKQFDYSEGKSLKNANFVADDDDDDEGDEKDETTTVGNDTVGSNGEKKDKKEKKEKKTNPDDPQKKPKRKYNKDPNRERKPYKKRAKKGETAATPKA